MAKMPGDFSKAETYDTLEQALAAPSDEQIWQLGKKLNALGIDVDAQRAAMTPDEFNSWIQNLLAGDSADVE
jgi:hypothetical protein